MLSLEEMRETLDPRPRGVCAEGALSPPRVPASVGAGAVRGFRCWAGAGAGWQRRGPAGATGTDQPSLGSEERDLIES